MELLWIFQAEGLVRKFLVSSLDDSDGYQKTAKSYVTELYYVHGPNLDLRTKEVDDYD